MRREIVRGAAALAIAAAILLGAAPAYAGSAAVGVRYGYANADGDLFEGRSHPNGDLVGVQLDLGVLPGLELELAGEYSSDPFTFGHGFLEGIEAAGHGDYQDLTLLGTARFQLLGMMLLPLQLYVGAGANVHYTELTLEDVVPVQGGRGTLDDAIRDVAGKSTEVGWHVVAGGRLRFSGVPISLFLEGRYQDPFKNDSGVPTTQSVYVGANLHL